jgi:hypothetical protein
MSVYKLGAAVAAIALCAAVVTALAGAGPEGPAVATPEVKAQPIAAKVTPVAAKGTPVDVRPVEAACPQEPWPFGCQWREPTRRVSNSRRSF